MCYNAGLRIGIYIGRRAAADVYLSQKEGRRVVVDVVLDHSHELFTTAESLAVISLTLEYSPKAFHRAIVYALG